MGLDFNHTKYFVVCCLDFWVISFMNLWKLWLNLMLLILLGAPPGDHQNGGRVGPVILELPLDKIRMPLMRTRANDPHKVKHLMDSIQQIGLQLPHIGPGNINQCGALVFHLFSHQSGQATGLTANTNSLLLQNFKGSAGSR
ncbi:hypothetical protein RJ641_001545 [Dillenia turbinata]|uniref:Uncharacterized protein n=1 Tax=Dillenia turbinata TaxID=194707 RepID=A0AAN8ZBC6_9MAGN